MTANHNTWTLSMLVAAFLAATAAPLAAQPYPAGSSVAAGDDLTRATIVAALPKITELATEATSGGTLPGLAVAVVFKDEVIYLEGFGTRQQGQPMPVGPDTIFPLASLSKPLSATVVAALVGEGVVGWDIPVRTINTSLHFYDPYVSDQVTLRDLLSHRSGLSGTAGVDLELIGYRQNEILERLALLPAGGSFRTSFAYSNYGFAIGALTAARASGKLWEDAATTRLYQPAGMKRTSSRLADYRDAEDSAWLHTMVEGKWRITPKGDVVAEAAPSGAANSTARDLATWMRIVLGEGVLDGRRIIDQAALAELQLPLLPTGPGPNGWPSYYGMGWSITSDEYGRHVTHNGAFTSGARTLVDLMPDEEIGIVVLANAFPSGVPEGLAASFYDLIFGGDVVGDRIHTFNTMLADHHARFVAALSGPLGKPVENPSEPLPLRSYVGRYSNEYVGEAIVSVTKESLELAVGPQGAKRYALLHHSRDVFYFRPLNESPDILLPVVFTIGLDGRATDITFGYIGGASHNRLGRVPAAGDQGQ